MTDKEKKLKTTPMVIVAIFAAQGLEIGLNHGNHDESINVVHTHNEFRLVEPIRYSLVAAVSTLTQSFETRS